MSIHFIKKEINSRKPNAINKYMEKYDISRYQIIKIYIIYIIARRIIFFVI